MKKSILFLLALCCLVSFAACDTSEGETSTRRRRENTEDVTANAEKEDFINDFFEGKIESNSEAPEKSVKATDLKIIEATDFSDGVAFISYHVQDENDNRTLERAAIDQEGNILYKADFLDGMIRYSNGILVHDHCIYDKQGSIIASPEKTGYDKLLTDSLNGYVMAIKKEESFSGDKYLIGVLNNSGQWEHPLSESNPVVSAHNAANESLESINIWDQINDTTIRVRIGYFDEVYYNLATNEVTAGYEYYESRFYQGQPQGTYKYNLSGDAELVFPEVDGHIFFEDVFIGSSYGQKDYKLYDYSGNIIADLSQYDLQGLWTDDAFYKNDHLLAAVDNGTGAEYLCLIKNNGELAFEPIRLDQDDNFYELNDQGFALSRQDPDQPYTTKYYFYDYEGNVKEFQNVKSFGGFSENLARVITTDGEMHYINTNGEIVI